MLLNYIRMVENCFSTGYIVLSMYNPFSIYRNSSECNVDVI